MYTFMCVCVSVWACTQIYINTNPKAHTYLCMRVCKYLYIYIYIYIYIDASPNSIILR